MTTTNEAIKMPKPRYPQKGELKTRTVHFNYKKAVDFITKYTGKNRPKGNADIKRYAHLMASGNWALTHQGIGLTTEDKIVDGQHRLDAIVYAYEKLGVDVLVPIRVTTGLDPSIFEILDQGRNRKAKDAFAIDGHEYPAELEGAVRTHWIRCNGRNIQGTGKLTIAEMQDHLAEHPILHTAASFIMGDLETPIKTFVSPGHSIALCALQFECHEQWETTQDEIIAYTKEFWKKFVDDDVEEPLTESDSPRIVRKYLQSCSADKEKKLTRDSIINILIAAYNTFLEGKDVKKIADFKPVRGERAVLGGLDIDPSEEE